MLADTALVTGLFILSRAVRAEEEIHGQEVKKHDIVHEEEKALKRGTKSKQKYEKVNNKAKFTDKVANTRSRHPTNNIQQPKKKGN